MGAIQTEASASRNLALGNFSRFHMEPCSDKTSRPYQRNDLSMWDWDASSRCVDVVQQLKRRIMLKQPQEFGENNGPNRRDHYSHFKKSDDKEISERSSILSLSSSFCQLSSNCQTIPDPCA